MEVVFGESLSLESSKSVIVIAATAENGAKFVEDKLKELFGTTIPDDIKDFLKDLDYKKIESFSIVAKGSMKEIIIVGAGKKESITRAGVEKLGGYIFDNIKSKEADISVFNNIENNVKFKTAAAYLASGISLKSWTFEKYKTKKNPQKIKSIKCQTQYVKENEEEYKALKAINEGVFLVREMATEPSNFMTPDQMREEAKALKQLGVKVTVLDKKDMEKLGMNALLGVGNGSDKPSYLIAMEYKTDNAKEKIALVGKGLTFDSGGICLKPAHRMSEMKEDMTGAAVVIGTIKAIATQKLKANIVGVIGVVENMISGSAQKPGDVVVSMSKKTIEIDNTDAEGRLVLADALWYAKEKYEPKVIIDFATLTGAIEIALGHEFAGLFSNSDELCEKLIKSADFVGEKLWKFPLHPSYEDDIKSDIADIRNTERVRGAGSITAALFLKHFVDKNAKWAHIDIAAVASDPRNRALSQKGATGFGVRLMNDFIKKYYN
ncbi:MAG: leucyl aminopeptidase [Holosporales bacterium]|jgi:leucyl aminopeptidase|nr:leucyl aminopeptidase [Holosporales bacterium]